MHFTHLFKASSTRITTAFQQARPAGSTLGLRLLVAPNEAEQTHFVIALTRQIKGGVKRNKLRRLIKEALRAWIANHGPLPPLFFLCVAYGPALKLTYQAIKAFLEKALCDLKNNQQ